jgi:hypothetical protein
MANEVRLDQEAYWAHRHKGGFVVAYVVAADDVVAAELVAYGVAVAVAAETAALAVVAVVLVVVAVVPVAAVVADAVAAEKGQPFVEEQLNRGLLDLH